jgi:hypothetical protein
MIPRPTRPAVICFTISCAVLVRVVARLRERSITHRSLTVAA